MADGTADNADSGGGTVAENARLRHEGLLALEQPLIKVPLEQLKRTFRASQKLVEREMATLVAQIETVGKGAVGRGNVLEASIGRLQSLKRKLTEIKNEEDAVLSRTKMRLDHLGELGKIQAADSDVYARWSATRLSRVLADYMLRQGFNSSATKLVQDENIQQLSDVELFVASRKIEESLRRRNCAECLAWCAENRSALKKIKSELEFNLRLQEYIEHLRIGSVSDAIAHARKYLTAWSDTHLRQITHAMGLVAFGPKTTCDAYRQLYDDGRWEDLVEQFKNDNYKLNCLTAQSPLCMNLQAGLAALKTTSCYKSGGRSIHCPVCDTATFGQLAETLPCAHHVNSCIVCRISGRIMDANNPPLVLPNGQVYSSGALNEMAAVNGGMVICPSSGASFRLSEARKAYIS